MIKRTFSTELNQPTLVRYDQIPETARMFRYFSLQILPDLYPVSLFDTWKSQGFQRTSIVLYIRKHFLFGYILIYIYIYSCDCDEVLKGLFWGLFWILNNSSILVVSKYTLSPIIMEVENRTHLPGPHFPLP